MAIKKTTKTSYTTKGGKQVEKTRTLDTGRQTGKQKSKKALSDNATKTAITGEIVGGVTSSIAARENAKVNKERERQKTYQAAIDKWNGILKSTPQPAEGSNDPLEGSNGEGNNTGDNQWKGF